VLLVKCLLLLFILLSTQSRNFWIHSCTYNLIPAVILITECTGRKVKSLQVT